MSAADAGWGSYGPHMSSQRTSRSTAAPVSSRRASWRALMRAGSHARDRQRGAPCGRAPRAPCYDSRPPGRNDCRMRDVWPFFVRRTSTRYVQLFVLLPTTNRIQTVPRTLWPPPLQRTLHFALTRLVTLQLRCTPVGVFFSFRALRNATDAYLFESRVVIRRFAARLLSPWTGLAPAVPPPPPPAAQGSVAGTSVPEVNVRAVGLAGEHAVGGVVQQWPVAVGGHVTG